MTGARLVSVVVELVRVVRKALSMTTSPARLARLETELDRCWDLLRQRRARVEAGQDPTGASVRPASEVEGYLS
ncbi:DUF2630 family protein [Streptomyces sp. NPDC004237]|uniref:DUF2630 family protein n=1 Tax=Streptomyces sp. NPDC004237 TaxID=3154455 RepID=UPI0033A0BDB7